MSNDTFVGQAPHRIHRHRRRRHPGGALAYATQPRAGRHGQPVVPIQDGKTIDFSGGSPVIRDSAADKAALDGG
jgi:hypothetical protein